MPLLPASSRAFLVFAQREDARIELSSWQENARRFFGVTLHAKEKKIYEPQGFPKTDQIELTLRERDETAHDRICFSRARTVEDLQAAERAEQNTGVAGLGLLAAKCKQVWLVSITAEVDRPALLLSAIMASVLLGPILSPDKSELFGVRTARMKLERL